MFRKVILTALILAAFTLLIVAKSNAAPFLVCDPQSGVVGYEITGLGDKINLHRAAGRIAQVRPLLGQQRHVHFDCCGL